MTQLSTSAMTSSHQNRRQFGPLERCFGGCSRTSSTRDGGAGGGGSSRRLGASLFARALMPAPRGGRRGHEARCTEPADDRSGPLREASRARPVASPAHARSCPPRYSGRTGASLCSVRLATWNVNSVTARLPRLLDWLAATAPDVVCLQETKTAEFPVEEVGKLGYDTAAHGDGRWNGVAVLSRVGLADVRHGLAGEPGNPSPEARAVGATCGDVRV